VAATLLLSGLAHAQAPADPVKSAEAPAAPAKRSLLKYTAPKGAATGVRIDGDGGSRGTEDKDRLPALYVLVPNQAALTTQEAPSLFWFQSAGADRRFEVTLNEPKNPKPLLKVGSEKSEKAGIHRISLAKQNVTLKPGITYKWTVAWVPKPDNRSLNVVAGGSIKRVEADASLTAALADAKGADKASVYAQNGIWYDALEAISNAIEAAPDDKELRALRAELLEQVGLKVAAAAERK
jgi:hypothetical protein